MGEFWVDEVFGVGLMRVDEGLGVEGWGLGWG